MNYMMGALELIFGLVLLYIILILFTKLLFD